MPLIEKVIENITEVFDIIKSNLLSVSLFLAISAWIALLLPKSVVHYFHMDSLFVQYLQAIGTTAFAATLIAILLTGKRLFSVAFSFFRSVFELPRLSPEECRRIATFLRSDSQTVPFYLTDGIVRRLEDKGLIYESRSRSNSAGEQDFHIYPWIFSRIKKHPDLIESKIKGKD